MAESGAWMRKRGPAGRDSVTQFVPENEIGDRMRRGWRQAPAPEQVKDERNEEVEGDAVHPE